MTQQTEIPFKLFRINSSPFVHPAFAICTAFRNPGGYLKSECFVLIQTLPTEGIAFGSRFGYGSDSEAELPVVVDEAFAMDDALHQAETMYSLRSQELDPAALEKRGWARPHFDEIAQHRLVSIWAHTPLSQPLLGIAEKSNCVALKDFIGSLKSLPTVKQTQLAL